MIWRIFQKKFEKCKISFPSCQKNTDLTNFSSFRLVIKVNLHEFMKKYRRSRAKSERNEKVPERSVMRHLWWKSYGGRFSLSVLYGLQRISLQHFKSEILFLRGKATFHFPLTFHCFAFFIIFQSQYKKRPLKQFIISTKVSLYLATFLKIR